MLHARHHKQAVEFRGLAQATVVAWKALVSVSIWLSARSKPISRKRSANSGVAQSCRTRTAIPALT
jgi:hypothetical protein